MAVSVRLEFIYTPLFEASAKGLLDDEAMRQLETTLLRDPQQGDVVAGTGGVRKLRAALPGRGKRGGARVIYLYVTVRGRVYFLLAYAKNRRVDLTPAEKRAVHAMARQLEREV
ncbi:MAG: type II toxin-antitoxin system RelE/ParE family toxin [Gemmatimonadales bacterium]|nr:type II toxin-antitoxin system RelE/ParE family toxin [Gemmatimonadales bacterium]